MNPFLTPQINIPTVKELWKKEISQYRLWVILFFVGITIIAALSFAAILFAGIGINDGVNELYNNYTKSGIKNPPTYNQTKIFYIMQFIVFPIVMFSLICVSITLIAHTIINSYKTKNFARVSGGSIIIIQISAFFAVINIIQIFINRFSIDLAFPSAIFTLIVNFLYVPVWFFVNKLSGIRKQFLYSERMEKLKNDPNFIKMQNQMNQFMQQAGQKTTNSQPTNQTNGNNSSILTPSNNKNIQSKDSAAHLELSKLNIVQLQNIAKKLYISGYKSMNKAELIESIKRISNM